MSQRRPGHELNQSAECQRILMYYLFVIEADNLSCRPGVCTPEPGNRGILAASFRMPARVLLGIFGKFHSANASIRSFPRCTQAVSRSRNSLSFANQWPPLLIYAIATIMIQHACPALSLVKTAIADKIQVCNAGGFITGNEK